MRTKLSILPSFVLIASIAAGSLIAACSGQSGTNGPTANGPGTPENATSDAGTTPVAAIPPVVPSKLSAELTAAGFDPNNLPSFSEVIAKFDATQESLGEPAAEAVVVPLMRLFAKSLGVECKECHSGPDKTVPIERQNLVAGMWDWFVRGLRTKEPGLLFCDSCHQGKKEFLARDDQADAEHKAVAAWMRENFEGKLTRVDGQPQTCASCHGEPFDGDFLATRCGKGLLTAGRPFA